MIKFKNNTLIYIASIVLVVLMVLSQIAPTYSVYERELDARFINMAGRQRMLSQQILKLAYEAKDKESVEIIQTMKEGNALWVDSHYDLIDGNDRLNFSEHPFPEEITKLKNLSKLVELMSSEIVAVGSVDQLRNLIDQLEPYEQQFLAQMDNIVLSMEIKTEAKIENAVRFERLFLLLSIVVFGILSFFIARPFITKLQKQLDENDEEKENLNRLFKSVFDNSGVGIALVDKEGKLFDVNEQFVQILGYTKKQLLSMTFAEFTHPDDVDKDLALYQELVEGKRDTYQMVKRYISKEKDIIWVELSASLIRESDGSPKYGVGMIRDITEKRKTESTLDDTRAILDISKKMSGIATWVIDFENDERIYDEQVLELYELDYKPDDIAKHLMSLVHPSDAQKLKEALVNARTNIDPWKVEYRIVTPSGKLKHLVTVVADIQLNEEGDVSKIIGTTQDISRVKEKENVLEQQKASLEDALKSLAEIQEVAHIGSWEVDLTTMSVDWSDEVYRIHEVPIGTPLKVEEGINFYREDYRPVIEAAINKAIEDSKPWDEECILVTQTGKEIWVRAIGHPVYEKSELVGLRGLFMNINDRKIASMQTELNERQLQQFVQQAPVAVAMIDADLNFITVSDQWYNEFDLTKGSLNNVKFQSMSHPILDYVLWADRLNRALNGKVLSKKKEAFTLDDGEQVWLKWKLIPWYDDPGKIGGLIMYADDITMEANYTDDLEEKVKERTAELELQTRKMAALNEELESFSYSISHDLRAPLRSINGFSDIMFEDYADELDEEGKRILGVIKNSALKMGRLIDDILGFSRLGRKSMQKGPVDMVALFESICDEEAQHYPEDKIDVKIGNLPMINADLVLLKQVVVNLISNAYKYSAKKEKIVVIVEAEEKEHEVIYSVTDNGTGFNMDYHEKLFGVFQRLHASTDFEGTGVGLAIVKRIINKHGGEIWAQSVEGEGSTFFFSLPKN